jgi:hypothetical protein
MTIHEPATLLTDYALTVIAGVLAYRLQRLQGSSFSDARRWFLIGLTLSAISAFVGGSYHGFAPNVSETLAAWWWKFTLLTLHLVSASLAMSLVEEVSPENQKPAWTWLVRLKFVAFACVAIAHPTFLVAIADYGTALVGWLLAASIGRFPWRRAMLAGIALSIVAAVVQQRRWAPSASFNHNDLYHVIEAVALFAFYRAGRQLGGASSTTKVATFGSSGTTMV